MRRSRPPSRTSGPAGSSVTFQEESPDRFEQHRVRSATGSREGVAITFLEEAFDPDPDDTAFDLVFVYLIHREGSLRIETDRHRNGLFPLGTWMRLLREVGFRVRRLDATLDPDREKYPTFVGLRPRPRRQVRGLPVNAPAEPARRDKLFRRPSR